MSSKESKLAARVQGVNQSNAIAMEWQKKLIEIFKPFVGQKILKADGYLLDKINKLMPKFPEGNVTIWRPGSNYSLYWTVKVSISVENYGVIYSERPFYVGKIKGNVLESIETDLLDLKIDHTSAEIAQKRTEYFAAKKKAEDLLSGLYPFGEFDS